MFPSRHHQLRYLAAVRRAKIARIAAAGAIVVVPSACSSGDDGVFGEVTVVTVPGTAIPDATSAPDTTTAPDTTSAPDTTVAPETTTIPDTTTAVTATASAFPTGSEMVVDFTYSTSEGRARNPYIAVWVEDSSGNLVQTISLWILQSQKGTRWIRDLSSWYSASGGDVATSGATRSAGAYTVAWDGTGLDGQLVAPGEYVLFVESAREHGPHSITSAPFTANGGGFTLDLPSVGELSGLKATVAA